MLKNDAETMLQIPSNELRRIILDMSRKSNERPLVDNTTVHNWRDELLGYVIDAELAEV